MLHLTIIILGQWSPLDQRVNMLKYYYILFLVRISPLFFFFFLYHLTAAEVNHVWTRRESVKADYFYEYSSQELDPFLPDSMCFAICTKQLGMAMTFLPDSRVCKCGIVDYTNALFNATAEIDLYISRARVSKDKRSCCSEIKAFRKRKKHLILIKL